MTTNETQLWQAQRLEQTGAMTCGLAHDLNNQLTLILNYIDFALHELQPRHPMRQQLEEVMAAAIRCSTLVASLMALGQAIPGAGAVE